MTVTGTPGVTGKLKCTAEATGHFSDMYGSVTTAYSLDEVVASLDVFGKGLVVQDVETFVHDRRLRLNHDLLKVSRMQISMNKLTFLPSTKSIG